MNAIKLIRIDFDNMENHDASVVKEIGIFVDGGKLTPHGKVEDYFRNKEPEKFYLGWDGNIYPQYKLERVELK